MKAAGAAAFIVSIEDTRKMGRGQRRLDQLRGIRVEVDAPKDKLEGMRLRVALAALILLFTAAALQAHDLFLRLESFFVTPQSTARVRVLNGTFSSSENAVARNRLGDISVVGPAGRTRLDTALWQATGDTSRLSVPIGEPGTYVIAASTLPREITLDAKDFNAYLAEDGIPDVLAARRRDGELGAKATERYSKHVKAVLQAGSLRSGSFDEILGYPAELVPLNNPYQSRAGGWLRVRAMVDGKAVANQLVVAGGRPSRGGRLAERRVRTDADGIARIRITDRGQWYVKFIHMVRLAGDGASSPSGTAPPSPALDYESKWATLTFEIR